MTLHPRMPNLVPTGSIQVAQTDIGLVVDSRSVAGRLGLNHGEWLTNVVKKYEKQCGSEFGNVHFQNGGLERVTTTGESRGTVQTKYALLTEEQAIFFMTCSRNKPEVIACKLELVKKFSQAKAMLSQAIAKPVTLSLEEALLDRLKEKAFEAPTIEEFVKVSTLATQFSELMKQI